MKTFASLFVALLVGGFMALAAQSFEVADASTAFVVTEVTMLAVGVGRHVLGTAPIVGAFALQTEVWVADIMDNLFLGMEFVSNSIDDSDKVNNKTVHVPNAGAKPNIVKNRSSYPGTIGQRTDLDITYNIDNFTTDPILVTDFEDVQLSYAKRESVMAEQMAGLRERIGNEMAYLWSPGASADHVLRTTGADSTEALAPSATGTRKKVTKEDIARMAKKLDKDLMPKEGRVLLMPADMYYELFGIDALIRADFMANSSSLPDGVVNKLFGFNVMLRADVSVYDNAANPDKKAVGAAGAASDNLGCLAFSRFAVRHAVGAVKVYHNPNVAEYYGDIMSAEVNFGGRISRNDVRGVVSLVQAHGA